MQKRILIINTGGTLSSVKGCNGLVPGMSSGDMLEELRMVSEIWNWAKTSVRWTVPISDRKTGPGLRN
ncbi:MAG: hypothetical protein ACLU8Z_04525 [Dorea sp.]